MQVAGLRACDFDAVGHNRAYHKKPLAVFENGTRIDAPSTSESRYRVVAVNADGSRTFAKFDAP